MKLLFHLALALLVAAALHSAQALEAYDDLVLTCLPTKDLGNGKVELGGKLEKSNASQNDMVAVSSRT